MNSKNEKVTVRWFFQCIFFRSKNRGSIFSMYLDLLSTPPQSESVIRREITYLATACCSCGESLNQVVLSAVVCAVATPLPLNHLPAAVPA